MKLQTTTNGLFLNMCPYSGYKIKFTPKEKSKSNRPGSHDWSLGLRMVIMLEVRAGQGNRKGKKPDTVIGNCSFHFIFVVVVVLFVWETEFLCVALDILKFTL